MFCHIFYGSQCISVCVCAKGRPKGVREEDVYICEYRVERTARRFSKIKQLRHPVNCRSYCFNRFLQKLQPKRTYVVRYLSNQPSFYSFPSFYFLPFFQLCLIATDLVQLNLTSNLLRNTHISNIFCMI